MSGSNIYKRWPVVAAETEHLHEDNKNGENRSGVLRSCAHFPLRLDISLFLQGDPGWSRASSFIASDFVIILQSSLSSLQ